MKYEIKRTSQFKKDFKKYCNDKAKLIALKTVLTQLKENGTVDKEYLPHPLKGNYKGTLECHIGNDFLLIWIDENNSTIKLVRLGTHSELFK